MRISAALAVLIVAGLIASHLDASRVPADPALNPDSIAIVDVVQRYARGFYVGSGDSVLATTHTELSKKGAASPFWGQQVEYLEWLEGDRLRLAGRYFDSQNRFDANTPSSVPVHFINSRIAVVELVAAGWYDAMTLVKSDGRWQILDIVWSDLAEYELPMRDAGERAEVQTLFMRFAREIQRGDRAALDSIIHPNLRLREFAREQGAEVVRPVTREQLYRRTHGAHRAALAGATPSVTVYNATRRAAFARVDHGAITYYVQALRLNGRWAVINATWEERA